jgi:hypothetical protein
MTTHKPIIELWPDINTFARDIGVNTNVARGIRERGWVPGWYWWKLVQAAERHGFQRVNLERLAKLASQRVK